MRSPRASRPCLLALAQDPGEGLADLLEPGEGASAQGGEGLGEADPLDHVRGGDRLALVLAEDTGGVGEPPVYGTVGCGEQVVVPAGRGHPCPVPRGGGQAPVGPGHPGGGDLGPREALEQGGVGLDGMAGGLVECGGVPGAADDGDAVVPGAEGGAQDLAHVCLAAFGVHVPGPGLGADGRHGLLDRGERGGFTVAALFDGVVPPAFGVAVAGCAGEHSERVGAGVCRVGLLVRALLARGPRLPRVRGLSGQCVGGGQVAEAHLHAVVDGVAQRHPLRREGRERPERPPARVVHALGSPAGAVDEQGDRRLELPRQVDEAVRLRRPFDEDRLGAQAFQFGPHGARGPGAVVAHPEDPHPLGVDGRHQAPTSRQAR